MDLHTSYGDGLDPAHVRGEYPRPQLVRDSYLSLNGSWHYAVDDGAERDILVPFPPESLLSGVQEAHKPEAVLHYRRSFTLPKGFVLDRVLLHLDAVDECCTVELNGQTVGTHEGGYLPFTLDVSSAIYIEGENTLIVTVRDPLSADSFFGRGKQSVKPGGIWYRPQSGIWGCVWLESVPEAYIEGLCVTPDLDARCVAILVRSKADAPVTLRFSNTCITGRSNEALTLPTPDAAPWTPEIPTLYGFTAALGSDRVTSYFGLRKFSVGRDENGIPRLLLNNEPYFQNGVLDQGYWPDGLLTAPSDAALIDDVKAIKRLGFNMVRKHIKLEPLRWYYHCDRLGLIVWQDMVSGGGPYSPRMVTLPLLTGAHRRDDTPRAYRAFGRAAAKSRSSYLAETDATVELLYNCVSIGLWTAFNEGWGQFDAKKVTARIREKDSTRLIDSTSGWHDQGCGDVKSLHVYFKPYHFHPDAKGRPVVLSEFGGFNLRVKGHSYSEKDFGYRRFADAEALKCALKRLYVREVEPNKARGLCAAVYTQLSDVEDELNGLLTFDRINKFTLRSIEDERDLQ